MRVKNTEFRQMAHSIKYIEYYWNEYQVRQPERADVYLYRKDVIKFIRRDTYSRLITVKKSLLNNDNIISKAQYKEMKYYSEICKNLQSELKS